MVSNLCLSQNHKDFLLYFLLEVLWAILSAKNGSKLFFTSGCLIASISFAKLAVFYLLYCLCTRSVAQSCRTLCNSVDCSLPGFSVHGILQARILEWVTISFSRGSSRPRDRTQVSHIGGRHFNLWATREDYINSCSSIRLYTIGYFCHVVIVGLVIYNFSL